MDYGNVVWICCYGKSFDGMVKRSLVQSFVLGALLGPVAYKAGEGLGLSNLMAKTWRLPYACIGLGFSMPLIYWVNDRLGLR